MQRQSQGNPGRRGPAGAAALPPGSHPPSRSPQDPVPILVTGRITCRRSAWLTQPSRHRRGRSTGGGGTRRARGGGRGRQPREVRVDRDRGTAHPPVQLRVRGRVQVDGHPHRLGPDRRPARLAGRVRPLRRALACRHRTASVASPARRWPRPASIRPVACAARSARAAPGWCHRPRAGIFMSCSGSRMISRRPLSFAALPPPARAAGDPGRDYLPCEARPIRPARRRTARIAPGAARSCRAP